MGTLREVASAAGVSVSTASRAFTAPGKVNAQTRERVRSAAGRLGYRPSPLPRTAHPGLTAKYGLIVPDIANPFFPPIIKAVQARARQRGHAVVLTDSDERPADELELARLMSREIDGLLVVSPRAGLAQLEEIRSLVPTVFVNREVPGAPCVIIDAAEGIQRAVQLLHALGHRTIAYLAGPRSSWADQQRRAAVEQESGRLGLELVVHGPFEPNLRSGITAADLLASSPVTGIIAYDDMIGLGVLTRLAERGIRPGHDISVIGVDDSPMAALAHPALTTVHVPDTQAGAAAVDLLDDLIADPTTVEVVRLDAYLVVRSSTGPGPTPPDPTPADLTVQTPAGPIPQQGAS